MFKLIDSRFVKIAILTLLFFTFTNLLNNEMLLAQENPEQETRNKEIIEEFVRGDVVDKFVEGKETELIVGFRVQSKPIVYQDPNDTDVYLGFCNVFADELFKQLKSKITSELENKNWDNTKIEEFIKKIKLKKLDSKNFAQGGSFLRFAGVTGEVQDPKDLRHIECGANSIRRDRDKVMFSEPFFYTGISLLTKKDNFKQIDTDFNLANSQSSNNEQDNQKTLKIGVIRESTTSIWLKNINYPETLTQTYQTRPDAILGLKHSEIGAYASDYVILKSLLDDDKEGLKEYTIYPPYYLATQNYGIVFQENQHQLLDLIDNTIKNSSDVQKEIRKLNENYKPKSTSRLDWINIQFAIAIVVLLLMLLIIYPVFRSAILNLLGQFWTHIKPEVFEKIWEFLKNLFRR